LKISSRVLPRLVPSFPPSTILEQAANPVV